MKLLRFLCLIGFCTLGSQGQATQLFFGPQCDSVGGYDTFASILSPPNLNECASVYTQDKGWFVSNGTGWVPLMTGNVGTGTPNARTLSLATAFQATNTTKPAIVSINLTSTATLSLSGGTTNTAQIVIGSTNAVASGTGTIIGQYSNSNTGTLTVGLNLSTISAVPYSFTLPPGWFFAVRQTSGTVSITSAFDQSLG